MAHEKDYPDTAQLIHRALAEDVGTGDVTTLATVPAHRKAAARIIAKAEGVLAGTGTLVDVLRAVDPGLRVETKLVDGAEVTRGDIIMEIRGSARSILTAERTALNFLGRLSGIATLTSQFAKAVEGTGAKILDTRKTTPGMRTLEKAAVLAGGGANHRIGLFDMVLIKENHIRAAGGITAAVRSCREYLTAAGIDRPVAVEVETTNMAEIDEALAVGCDRIMLDNMTLDDMRAACRKIRAAAPGVEIEASGNMSVERVRAVAETGVHLISVGALTHSAPALDVSLLFDQDPD